MRLKDKVAVVTGVESGSIGQATALLFAEEGATVVVAGISGMPGIETVALIRKNGGEALLVNVDIASENDVKQACEYIVSAFGRLDILVNTDAASVPGLDPAAENWQNSLKLNVIDTVLMSRYAGEAMKRHDKGAIVNTVSTSGPAPRPTYSATQAALLQLSRDMAVDLAPHNIRVNCVCHGGIGSVTSPEQPGPETQTAEMPSATQLSRQVINRMGQPREVAYAILFLASDEASFITGAHLVVDGGYNGTVKSNSQQHSLSRVVAAFS